MYDTLNQTLCDLNFKDCLNQICTAKEWRWSFLCPFSFLLSTDYWNENCEESLRIDREKSIKISFLFLKKKNCIQRACLYYIIECNAAVEVLYHFVHGLGSSAYANAQKQACVCIPDEEIGLPIFGFFLGGLIFALLLLALFFLLRKRSFATL